MKLSNNRLQCSRSRRGLFAGGRLSVGHQPGRIDLILMPAPPPAPPPAPVPTPDQNNPPDGLSHLGDFDLAMDSVIPAARKMFRPDMVMQRLAVGAVLLDPAASVADGYKRLKSILPVARELPENASDFFFQLNIPATVSVTGISSEIRINRLLKWAVARFRIMNMIGGPSGATQIVSGTQIPVVRVEMDLSTPADLSVALAHQDILDLIDHLAAQARAIAGNAGWFPE